MRISLVFHDRRDNVMMALFSTAVAGEGEQTGRIENSAWRVE